jgi:hypothetical protein
VNANCWIAAIAAIARAINVAVRSQDRHFSNPGMKLVTR